MCVCVVGAGRGGGGLDCGEGTDARRSLGGNCNCRSPEGWAEADAAEMTKRKGENPEAGKVPPSRPVVGGSPSGLGQLRDSQFTHSKAGSLSLRCTCPLSGSWKPPGDWTTLMLKQSLFHSVWIVFHFKYVFIDEGDEERESLVGCLLPGIEPTI